MGTGARTPSPSWPRGESFQRPEALLESYKATWTSRGGWRIRRPPATYVLGAARLAAWRASHRGRACGSMAMAGGGDCRLDRRSRQATRRRSRCRADGTSARCAERSSWWSRGPRCPGAGTQRPRSPWRWRCSGWRQPRRPWSGEKSARSDRSATPQQRSGGPCSAGPTQFGHGDFFLRHVRAPRASRGVRSPSAQR
jgi:hypothetical protein